MPLKRKIGAAAKSASRLGEFVLKLAMHIPSVLVLLNRPEEQRLTAARFFPSFPDVLFLLLVLYQTLAFVLDEQNAPVEKFGGEIGIKRAGGSWETGRLSCTSIRYISAHSPIRNARWSPSSVGHCQSTPAFVVFKERELFLCCFTPLLVVSLQCPSVVLGPDESKHEFDQAQA